MLAMENKLKHGDVIEVSRKLHNDMHGTWKVIWEKYEVLKVYPHFVLCRKARGGYRECFTWYQLRVAAE